MRFDESVRADSDYKCLESNFSGGYALLVNDY